MKNYDDNNNEVACITLTHVKKHCLKELEERGNYLIMDQKLKADEISAKIEESILNCTYNLDKPVYAIITFQTLNGHKNAQE